MYLSVQQAEAIRGGHGLGNKSWRPKTSGAEVHTGNNNNNAGVSVMAMPGDNSGIAGLVCLKWTARGNRMSSDSYASGSPSKQRQEEDQGRDNLLDKASGSSTGALGGRR